MRHHVRYKMMWGHKLNQRGGEPIEVTRAEYNASFGVEIPDEPDIPDCIYYIWEIWWRLNARRPTGDNQTPISWVDLKAFCDMTNTILFPVDVAMIEAIDNAYLMAISEERRGAFERARDESDKPKKAKK